MTTTPIPNRCPHADACWKGGGSYACVTHPPFCDYPLIPKKAEVKTVEVGKPEPVIVSFTNPSTENGGDIPIHEMTQGELF